MMGYKRSGREHFVICKCTSLSRITLSSTVTEVGDAAFYNCSNLNKVVLNEGLQKIGRAAFYSCTSLSSITLPSTVTEIGEWAFSRCNSLREFSLHVVPQKIAKDAFYNCTSLERFTFPTISTRLYNLIQTGHWDEIENEVDEVRGVVERSDGDYLRLLKQWIEKIIGVQFVMTLKRLLD